MSDLLKRLRAALACRYVVERQLGRDGVAVVHLAEHARVRWLGLVCAAALVCASCDAGSSRDAVTETGLPTYADKIASIVHANCASCHRPGEAGPFPLLTYEDVSQRAQRIKEVTGSRYMPPWPADPNYTRFRDEKILTEDEIGLIGAWVDAGAPLGDPTELPPPPEFPEASQLGEPDLILEMPEPFIIPGDRTDRFTIVRVPFELPSDTFIRVVEFVPGNRSLVHHMNGHLITYEDGKKSNLREGAVFVEDANHNQDKLEELNLLNDDGSFAPLYLNLVNYLPGVQHTPYPEGVGYYFPLRKQNILLVNDIHYGPSTVDTFDVSRFNLFFGPAPQRRVSEVLLGTHGVAPVQPELTIPSDSVKEFRIEFQVPIDISVLTVNPHMHLLGKEFKAYAVTRMYETIPLIRINQWDFRWQYFYTFPKMVKIPAGSTIIVEAVYDNTSNNPNNPFDPPRLVSDHEGSMKSTDEMLQLIISWTAYQPGDENISLENVRLD